ncbi:MAG: Gfo/Idh/MocA family oxidoreductase [Bryobacteraceae bacterium]
MKSRRHFVETLAIGGMSAAAQTPRKSDPGKKIRMAVVGGGFGSSFHWHEHPQCVVTAVTDLYAVRRNKLRDAYRCDNVYNSLEDMLSKRNDLDAIAIFSQGPAHPKHVKMSMEHGLHVVSAVPACMALEDAQMLVDVKKKTGKRYMMAESSYYRQQCIFARERYKKGDFGEIFYTECEYYHDFDFDQRLNKQPSLYYNPDGSNSWRQGMPPMIYPTHSLAFVTGVTGEKVVSVSCQGLQDRAKIARLKSNPYQNPFFNEFALMRTDKGHMVRHNECRQIAAPETERAQWYGEKASLLMERRGVHPDSWHSRYGKPEPAKVPNYWMSDMLPPNMRHESGHGGSAVFISAEFINALLEDRDPVVDLSMALAISVPGIVANQSALKDGELMKVPIFA